MNNRLIFENRESLSFRDILLQILFGLGILLVGFILGEIRSLKEEANHLSLFGLGVLLLVVWVFKALRETILHKVEVNLEADKLTITLEKQFGKKQQLIFKIKELDFIYSSKPGRSIPRNKILTLHDNTSSLDISSRQKGLSEEVLNEIVEQLEVLLTTTPIR